MDILLHYELNGKLPIGMLCEINKSHKNSSVSYQLRLKLHMPWFPKNLSVELA